MWRGQQKFSMRKNEIFELFLRQGARPPLGYDAERSVGLLKRRVERRT
jgi:hypothetical protein